MRKYFDEKMFVTILAVGIVWFFLQHWLSTKVVGPDGKLNVFIGTDETGHAKIK